MKTKVKENVIKLLNTLPDDVSRMEGRRPRRPKKMHPQSRSKYITPTWSDN